MDQRIIGRIRKMLRLANDAGATEGERDNALRMAHATLAKYNLSISEIETPSEPRVKHTEQYFGRPWSQTITHAVAKLLFCEYVYSSARQANRVQHHFIGLESNAITAGEMAKFLVTSIMREGKRKARIHGQGNAYVRSFATGAANSIRCRVNELMTSPIAESEGKSLVPIYNQQEIANKAMVSRLYPTLSKSSRGKRTGSIAAYEQGKEYGNDISLQRSIT